MRSALSRRVSAACARRNRVQVSSSTLWAGTCAVKDYSLTSLMAQVYLPRRNDMPQVDTATATTPVLPAGHWTIDPHHAGIEFGIKHLLITTVKGTFNDFEGTIDITDDGRVSAV